MTLHTEDTPVDVLNHSVVCLHAWVSEDEGPVDLPEDDVERSELVVDVVHDRQEGWDVVIGLFDLVELRVITGEGTYVVDIDGSDRRVHSGHALVDLGYDAVEVLESIRRCWMVDDLSDAIEMSFLGFLTKSTLREFGEDVIEVYGDRMTFGFTHDSAEVVVCEGFDILEVPVESMKGLAGVEEELTERIDLDGNIVFR